MSIRHQILKLVEDFAEVPHAGGLVGEPLGGADRAEREAAAAEGVVAQLRSRRNRLSR